MSNGLRISIPLKHVKGLVTLLRAEGLETLLGDRSVFSLEESNSMQAARWWFIDKSENFVAKALADEMFKQSVQQKYEVDEFRKALGLDET
jgi:hypothetical protein